MFSSDIEEHLGDDFSGNITLGPDDMFDCENKEQKVEKCPFCGETPQISCYDKRQIMHACRVLNKELRFDIEAWNTRVAISKKEKTTRKSRAKKICLELTIPETMDLLCIVSDCKSQGWYYGRKDYWVKHLDKIESTLIKQVDETVSKEVK